MILVTGPLFAGKRACIQSALGLADSEMAAQSVCDVQELADTVQSLDALADSLAQHPIVIATELGGGVVPTDPAQRRQREAAGRLAQLLAERATVVIRVCCGLPQVMKGDFKC